MQDLVREHDREIRLAHTQTSAVSEHDYNTGHPPLWNEVTFIDRDPHSFTPRVKESIHMRIHSDNIDRDGGIEIPEAWMPTIRKKHNNRRAVRQRTAEGTNQRNREETPQEKCVFRYQVPKHITLNDVIMVTGIIGIRTTRINGIRNVLTKEEWDTGYSDP